MILNCYNCKDLIPDEDPIYNCGFCGICICDLCSTNLIEINKEHRNYICKTCKNDIRILKTLRV